MTTRSPKSLTAIAVMAGSLLLTACEKPPEVKQHMPLVKYERISAVDSQQQRTLSGVVQSAQSSSLSFQVGGRVLEVLVNSGSKVSKGDLLAHLDETDFKRALDKSKAQLASTQSEFDERRRNLQRMEELWQERTISGVQYSSEVTAFESASSNLEVSKLQLESSAKDLADTRLIAPFDGVISARKIEPFTEVKAGNSALVIDTPNQLQVKVLVPETLVRSIYYGQPVIVSLPTLSGYELRGAVSEIGSQVETGNAFAVKVALENNDVDVRTGMTASASFQLKSEAEQGFLLPLSAFVIDARPLGPVHSKQATIFVYNAESSKLESRKVLLGKPVDERVLVLEGLQEGEIVVVAGVPFLKAGMTVNLWEPSNG